MELVFVVTFIVETRGLLDNILRLATRLTSLFDLGRTLEETAALFDGEDQPQDLAAMGGDAATMTMTMSRPGVATRDHEADQKELTEFHEMRSRQRVSESDDPRVAYAL